MQPVTNPYHRSWYYYIEDHKWYRYLVPKHAGRLDPGLLDEHPVFTITTKLIVCMVSYIHSYGPEPVHLFAIFDEYWDFGRYQQKFVPEQRCFFEIILGELLQKPHFDIDINLIEHPNIQGDQVIDNLIQTLITLFNDQGIQLNLASDILLYTSHGLNKRSYHVVINNYCHRSNQEAKLLYEAVVQKMKPELAFFVDKAVYSPRQQFRIIGSQKLGSGRPKMFNETWTYQNTPITYQYVESPDDEGHKMMMQLEASLVSNTTNCKVLSCWSQPKPPPVIPEFQEDLPREMALRALQLCANLTGMSYQDYRFPYRLAEIKGDLVMLKRVRPSRCRICNRIHEHENPYLIVVGPERTVYFHCRRAPDSQRLLVGKLEPYDASHPKDEIYPEIAIDWVKSVTDNLDISEIAQSSIGVKSMTVPSGYLPEGDQHQIKRIMKKAIRRGRWKS